jgi:hypothetical protein
MLHAAEGTFRPDASVQEPGLGDRLYSAWDWGWSVLCLRRHLANAGGCLVHQRRYLANRTDWLSCRLRYYLWTNDRWMVSESDWEVKVSSHGDVSSRRNILRLWVSTHLVQTSANTSPAAAVITADNKSTELALIFMGCFFIGWNETVCLANATIMLHDQQEIGVAGGVAGAIRGAISAISLSVYTAVLTNRLTTTVATRVPTALTGAGLPASSVEGFIAAISVGTPQAFQQVPGVTDRIIAVGVRAYQVANAEAYRTVYLSTIAFSGLGLILTLFAKNTEKLMLDSVAATLHGEGTERSGKEEVDEEKIPH